MECDTGAAVRASDAELVQTRKELRKLAKRCRRIQQSGVNDNCKIAPLSKLVILILYAISGNTVLAVEYFQRYKQRYHKMNIASAELTSVVEDWLLDLPQEDYNNLLVPTTALHTKALSLARKFAAEHATVVWVEHNNEVKGVAPATGVTMKKMETELVGAQRLAEDMDYDTREDLTVSRHRDYAYRFRKRWNITLDRLREHAVVSLQERQQKVPIFSLGMDFEACFRGPFLGTQKEAQNPSHAVYFSLRRDYCRVPSFGTSKPTLFSFVSVGAKKKKRAPPWRKQTTTPFFYVFPGLPVFFKIKFRTFCVSVFTQ